MDTLAPFSLRYHNRDSGSSAAPTRRVPIGDQGDSISVGDPVQIEGGVAAAYNAGDGVFGVAYYDFPDYESGGTKDHPDLNHPLIYPANDSEAVYRVQAKNIVSEEAVAVDADGVLGHAFNLGGSAGEMYLDLSATGTDFLVIDIDRSVSEWGDDYPVLLVQIINPQDVDPTV